MSDDPSPSPQSNRRAFLQGRAALDALAHLVIPPDAPSAGDPPSLGDPANRTATTATYLIEVSRRAMACQFQVHLNAGQQPEDVDAAIMALDEVERLEQQLSIYREDSEVSRLNRAAFSAPVRVSDGLWELLQTCRQLARETDGAFDVTAGKLSKLWGFFDRQGRFPKEDEIADTLDLIGTQWIDFDSPQRTVQFQREGIEINFGSIGKGYALDQCEQLLSGAGVDHFLIHGGLSSVVARGSRCVAEADSTGWNISLRNPLRPDQLLGTFQLENRSLATSGSGQQYFHFGGRRYGHILNPRSGRPVEGVWSTTVIAPSATMSDALATAFFVMGVEAAQRYCQAHPETAALFVLPGPRDGSVDVRPVGQLDSIWSPAQTP